MTTPTRPVLARASSSGGGGSLWASATSFFQRTFGSGGGGSGSVPTPAAAAAVQGPAGTGGITTTTTTTGGNTEGGSPSFFGVVSRALAGKQSVVWASAPTPMMEMLLAHDDQVDWDTDKKPAVTEECPICTTADAVLFRTASCGHEACERCWMFWRKENMTCLICAQKCDAPQRSRAVTMPQSPTPQGTVNVRRVETFLLEATKRLDESLEDVLRAVIRIKTVVLGVETILGTTKDHLAGVYREAQSGSLDGDAATSIVQVEMLTVREQLEALDALSPERFNEMDKTLTVFEQSLSNAEKAIDCAMAELDRNTRPSESSGSTPILLLTLDTSHPTVARAARTLVASLRSAGPTSGTKTDSPVSQQFLLATNTLESITTTLHNLIQILIMVMPLEGIALMSMFEDVKYAPKLRTLTSRIQKNEKQCRYVRGKALVWLQGPTSATGTANAPGG